MEDLGFRANVSLLLDRNLEAGRGDKVAVRCGDEHVTYTQLLGLACQAGRALADRGVRREERVLLVLDDTPAFPATFLGAIRIGAVPVPVNFMYKASDYAYFLADSYARVAVVDDAFSEKLREAAAEYGAEQVQIISPGELLSGAEDETFDPVITHEDDMAFWLYSSGSTGRPKGVVHRQVDVAGTCETYGVHVLGLTADDVTYSSSKLFHAYGLGNGLSFPFWAGATAVYTPGRPVPEAVFGAIERYRPTHFFCVPTLYNALLNTPGAKERDLSSVRLCLSAAEPLPPEVFHRWKESYGVLILDAVGSTEMLHCYCANLPDAMRPGSSGRPIPGYELQIRDEDGTVLGPGGVGELFVKGDSALAGYWHHRDKTRRTLHGEWFATGDRYHLDDNGFYTYEGRADDMIKVGGLWVSPIEIENTLMEHPAVNEAAVVGVDVDGFTRIRAHVVCAKGSAAEAPAGLAAELQEWCKSRLQRYQYPHMIEFADELPKTVTGKIQRFVLRQPAEQEPGA
ncbi:MAG: benzoate-CoA ligase family protein [Actinomycetota bacterium]|nr:benzoate-CoA ligase family protein [Actinomycetota bacterium]